MRTINILRVKNALCHFNDKISIHYEICSTQLLWCPITKEAGSILQDVFVQFMKLINICHLHSSPVLHSGSIVTNQQYDILQYRNKFFRHLVGLPGQKTGLIHGLYKHKTTHKKGHNIHAPSRKYSYINTSALHWSERQSIIKGCGISHRNFKTAGQYNLNY